MALITLMMMLVSTMMMVHGAEAQQDWIVGHIVPHSHDDVFVNEKS